MSLEFRIVFRAKDYEASVDFYTNQLSLPVSAFWDRGPAERGTCYQAAAGTIEVLALPPGQAYVQPTGFEIAIEVENVDEIYQQCKQKKMSFRGELANKPWGHRAFSLNDPDGIKVIIYSIIK
jgi:catechol 2,3-dioxygenase-like lactoylglutathione lyase family enzyme